jgi:hypothetical protein
MMRLRALVETTIPASRAQSSRSSSPSALVRANSSLAKGAAPATARGGSDLPEALDSLDGAEPGVGEQRRQPRCREPGLVKVVLVLLAAVDGTEPWAVRRGEPAGALLDHHPGDHLEVGYADQQQPTRTQNASPVRQELRHDVGGKVLEHMRRVDEIHLAVGEGQRRREIGDHVNSRGVGKGVDVDEALERDSARAEIQQHTHALAA